MPYIVTTQTGPHMITSGPHRGHETRGIVTRRAVATLDEARTPDGTHIAPYVDPERGGTIGPLPDGTVIEVKPVSYAEMRADLKDADPGWTGDDDLVLTAWADLFEAGL